MRRTLRILWVQVLIAMVLGTAVGIVRPSWGVALQPLGDGFIRLVRMIIAPIIFTTLVTSISRAGGRRKMGRVAWKAIVVFEVLTTIALILGFVAGWLSRVGSGMNVDPKQIDASAIAPYTAAGKALTPSEFLLGIIPRDVVDAFARDDVLQVIFFSVLFSVAIAALRDAGREVLEFVEDLSALLFRIMAMVMRAAPIGAFGAMAFTIGKFGLGSVLGLGKLVAVFYVSCALFIVLVLAGCVRLAGLRALPFLRYLRQEVLITLGTSSSESALPLLMSKMHRAGCSEPVVGFVVPLGYSFNLTGTSIYLTLATVFIAEATNTRIAIGKALALFAIMLVTSKTAAAVTGGGFVTLAATLMAAGDVPVAGLTLLVGIDRIMSEARAFTNLTGNAVAAAVVSRWEGELDVQRAERVLSDVAAVEREEYEAGRADPAASVPDIA